LRKLKKLNRAQEDVEMLRRMILAKMTSKPRELTKEECSAKKRRNKRNLHLSPFYRKIVRKQRRLLKK
jgi:hypothetical protein